MIKNSQLTVPVLLVAFNRPDTTKIVFERIRAARPLNLYVAVDGPRKEIHTDEKLVAEVRRLVQEIDWPCNTAYRFNQENAGAEKTVSSAISWVLENEEYVIILEDDIVAPLSFCRFTQEMLIRYADEPSIGTVTGSNFTPIPEPSEADYFFAKYGHSWGWGTWKRAWYGYDLNVEIADEHLTNAFLNKITNSRQERNYYKKDFKRMKEKGPGNSTWDHVARYYHRVYNRLSVIPKVNLTTNIGIYGLHAKGKTEHHFRPYDEKFEVKKHPAIIECSTEYDKHHFKHYINKNSQLHKRILRKAMKVIGLR